MEDNKSQSQKDLNQDKDNKDAPVKPDPETLGTTDPQEHMGGVISSLAHLGGNAMKTKKSKEEATKKRDNEM